ncbi:kinase [Actinomadura kijaniata]|uniref:kinase n=1 Tax=Actinomadura kijaniata TaxID=46161 RepID=UPI003F1CBF69
MRTLIVPRGDSGSGKTTVTRRLRLAGPHRDVAVAGQDVVRREILREHDIPGGADIALIDTIVRHALAAARHAPMLETLRRHATRPQRAESGPTEMAAWYHPRDLLPTAHEKIIPETVDRPLTETSLLTAQPLPRRPPGDPAPAAGRVRRG